MSFSIANNSTTYFMGTWLAGSEDDDFDPAVGETLSWQNFLWFAVYLTIIVPNLLGNVSVCLIILRSRSMKSFTYYLLANLAASDILVGVFGIPEAVLFTLLKRFSTGFMCKFLQAGIVMKLGAAVSIYNLVFISIERYFAICKPFQARVWLTQERLKIIIPTLWVGGALWCSPVTYFVYDGYDNRNNSCFFVPPKDPLVIGAFVGVVSATYFLSMGVIGYSFVKIVQALWGRPQNPRSVSHISALRSRRKVIKLIASVIILFNICMLPHFTMTCLVILGTGSVRTPVFKACYILAVAQSSCNPIIYGYTTKSFRDGFKQLFCKCVSRRSTKNDTVTLRGRLCFLPEMGTHFKRGHKFPETQLFVRTRIAPLLAEIESKKESSKAKNNPKLS